MLRSKISTFLIVLLSISLISCSNFYAVSGKDSIKGPEAALKLQEAVLVGMVLIVSSTDKRLGSLATATLVDSAAGIDSKDASALYEKKKVDACADSISTAIVATSNIDSGFFAASSCKLKKLP